MSIIIRLQNLPLEANSLDIRRFFQGLHIPDGGVHIVGGDHGDAFIAFGTDEDARQAMERNGNQIKSSRIKLLLSSRNEMQRVIDAARNQTMSIMSSSGNNNVAASSQQLKPPIIQPVTPMQMENMAGMTPPQHQQQQPMPQQYPPSTNYQHYPPQQGPMNQSPQQPVLGSTGPGYYQQQQQAISNGPPPFGGMMTNNSNQQQSNDHHGYDRSGPLNRGPPGEPPGSFRRQSRSRSRSPPVRNRFSDQQHQSDYQSAVGPQPPQPNSSMHSGLLGSLPPPQQYSQQNNSIGSYQNQNNANSHSVYQHQQQEEPPRDLQSSFGAYRSSYPPTPAGAPSNLPNDLMASNKYQPPPPDQLDRWNQRGAPGASGSDDIYRKMDSIHQQAPPSGQYNQQQQPFHHNSGEPLIQQPPPSSSSTTSSLSAPRMFTLQLNDLPFNVRQDDLIKFFHPLYLNEDNIKIFYDEKGFPTGIALVRFASPREWESALGYNNRYLGDRPVHIRPLDDLNGPQINPTSAANNNSSTLPHQIPQQHLPSAAVQQTSPLMPTPPSNNNDPYRSENYPPYRNTPEDIASFGRQPQTLPQQYNGGPMPPPNVPQQQSHPQPQPRCKELVLYMKGLPFSNCTENDVAQFFKPIQLANIEIEIDQRGKPTGNAFVEFRNHQDLDRGMEYNMRHMGRRYIELIPMLMYEKYGPNYHMPSAPPPPKFARSGGPGSYHHHGNHQPPPITYCISVRGLSKHVTSKELKSYFAKMNAETYAVHIMLTSDRMNAGEAFVEFISKENQSRALERDGDYIGHDRLIIRPIPYDVVRNSIPLPPPHHRGGPPGPHRGPSDYHHSSKPSRGLDNNRYNRDGSSERGNNNSSRPRGGGPPPPGPPRSGSAPPFYDKATVLIAKNISYKANDEDICVFFADYHITPSRVKRRPMESANNKDQHEETQEAQISFHSKGDAEHAQRNMDKKYFLDRKIHLTFG